MLPADQSIVVSKRTTDTQVKSNAPRRPPLTSPSIELPMSSMTHVTSPSNRILSKFLKEDRDVIAEKSNNLKRKLRECSEIFEQDLVKKPQNMRIEEWKKRIGDQAEEWLQLMKEIVEEEIISGNTVLKALNRSLEEGHISRTEHAEEIAVSETQLSQQQKRWMAIDMNLETMKGITVDEHLQNQELKFAYVDLLISRFESPTAAKYTFKRPRTKEDDARWKRECYNHYNANHPKHEDGNWCVVSRAFVAADGCSNAHIIPYNVGESTVQTIFGERQAPYLTSVDNILPMTKMAKRALDKALIAIVPAEPGDKDPESKQPCEAGDLKIIVLNEAVYKTALEKVFGRVHRDHLDGRVLGFRNKNRPSLKFLYLRAFISIALRQRYLVPGWADDQKKLAGTQWKELEKGKIKRSFLWALATYIGLADVREKPMFLDPGITSGSRMISPEDKQAAYAVQEAVSPFPGRNVVFK